MQYAHLISLLFLSTPIASGAPLDRYINGSYVNVRANPVRNATVIDHVIVNTPVSLLSQSADYCEIKWGNDKRGFVACNLIGTQALRIEDFGTKYLLDANNKPIIDQNYRPKPNPAYSPLRVFWIAPSVEGLFEAGEYFQQIALPASQLQEELDFASKGGGEKVPELKRFPLPEFEAMKALMANGIVAPQFQYTAPTSWKTIQGLIQNPNDRNTLNRFQRLSRGMYFDNIEKYVAIYKGFSLPIVKPSFFKTLDAIGRPGDGAESLSAQYKIPFKMTVLGGPTWAGDNNSYPLLVGAWDIGEIEVKLTRPVYEVSVGIDGQLSIGETQVPSRNSRGDPSQYCLDSFRMPTSNSLTIGRKQIAQPWIFFRFGSLPSLSNARVTIKTISSPIAEIQDEQAPTSGRPAKKKKAQKLLEVSKLEGHETSGWIDLDNDGADDLAVWDDGGAGVDLDYHRQRLIFANVMGQWYLLDADEVHACGC